MLFISTAHTQKKKGIVGSSCKIYKNMVNIPIIAVKLTEKFNAALIVLLKSHNDTNFVVLKSIACGTA